MAWLYWGSFVLAVPLVALAMAFWKSETRLSIPVPTRYVAAFRVVKQGDLTTKKVTKEDLPAGAVTSAGEAVGRYPLSQLAPGQPMLETDFGPRPPARLLAIAVAVAVPVTAETSLGGTIGIGDVVTLVQIRRGSAPRVFGKILVLAVTDRSIVVALPRSRFAEYGAGAAGATYVLARAVS